MKEKIVPFNRDRETVEELLKRVEELKEEFLRFEFSDLPRKYEISNKISDLIFAYNNIIEILKEEV